MTDPRDHGAITLHFYKSVGMPIVDICLAGLVLGASLGGIAGSWSNPALGMVLGADAGMAMALIWHVITRRVESCREAAVAGLAT